MKQLGFQLGLLILCAPIILNALDNAALLSIDRDYTPLDLTNRKSNQFYADKPRDDHKDWTGEQHFQAANELQTTLSQYETETESINQLRTVKYHLHMATNYGDLGAVRQLIDRYTTIDSLLSQEDLDAVNQADHRRGGYAWSPPTLYVLACSLLTNPQKTAADIAKGAAYAKLSAATGFSGSSFNPRLLAWRLNRLNIITLAPDVAQKYLDSYHAMHSYKDIRWDAIHALDLPDRTPILPTPVMKKRKKPDLFAHPTKKVIKEEK